MSKKGKRSKIVSVIIMMAIAGAAGYLAASLGIGAASAIPKIVLLSLFLLFVPAFFLVVGFHEGGHALAGIWVNFDFRMYVIGPFMWEKEETGWKFKWNKNVNTSGGMVLCLPTESENLKNRFSVYAAGGPLASLLLAVIAYSLFNLILPPSISKQVVLLTLAYLLFLIAFLSSIIFIATSLPFHFGGFSSDGARILHLQQGGDKARFELLILKIMSSSAGGMRPSLLNSTELEEAQVLAKKLNAPFGVYLHSYFHQACWDKGDLEAAEKHLMNYISEIESIPDGIRSAVWLDAAFFYAHAKKDIDQAIHYWNQFKPSAIIPKAQILATEAAISSLKNEKENSLLKIENAVKELVNMIDRGVAISLRDKLNLMRIQNSKGQ